MASDTDYLAEWDTIYATWNATNANSITPDWIEEDSARIASPSAYYFTIQSTTEISLGGDENDFYKNEGFVIICTLDTSDKESSATIKSNLSLIWKELKRIINVYNQTYPAYRVSYESGNRFGRHTPIFITITFREYGVSV